MLRYFGLLMTALCIFTISSAKAYEWEADPTACGTQAVPKGFVPPNESISHREFLANIGQYRSADIDANHGSVVNFESASAPRVALLFHVRGAQLPSDDNEPFAKSVRIIAEHCTGHPIILSGEREMKVIVTSELILTGRGTRDERLIWPKVNVGIGDFLVAMDQGKPILFTAELTRLVWCDQNAPEFHWVTATLNVTEWQVVGE